MRVVVLLALVAACGLGPSKSYEQSHSAQQIVSDATRSTGASRSYHISLDESSSHGPAHVELDIEDGNARGKITGPSMSLRIVLVGGKSFVYGSDLATLLAPADGDGAVMIRAAAADKWVLVSARFWKTNLIDAIDLRTLSSCLRAAGGLSKNGISTVAGLRAVEVDDQRSSRFYIGTAAPHYLVHANIASGDSCATDATATSQVFDMSMYGEKFGIAVPNGYLDLNTIG